MTKCDITINCFNYHLFYTHFFLIFISRCCALLLFTNSFHIFSLSWRLIHLHVHDKFLLWLFAYTVAKSKIMQSLNYPFLRKSSQAIADELLRKQIGIDNRHYLNLKKREKQQPQIKKNTTTTKIQQSINSFSYLCFTFVYKRNGI